MATNDECWPKYLAPRLIIAQDNVRGLTRDTE